MIANWGHDVLRIAPSTAKEGMSLGSFFLLGDPHVEGEEDVDSNPDPVELPVAAIDTEGTSFRLHVLVLLFDPKCGELGCEELPLFSDLDRS